MDVSVAGRSFPTYEFHVERGKIREFADALQAVNQAGEAIIRGDATAALSRKG